MKKVLTTIALSISALLATSAMAAPQHDSRYDHNPHKPAPHWNAKDSKNGMTTVAGMMTAVITTVWSTQAVTGA